MSPKAYKIKLPLNWERVCNLFIHTYCGPPTKLLISVQYQVGGGINVISWLFWCITFVSVPFWYNNQQNVHLSHCQPWIKQRIANTCNSSLTFKSCHRQFGYLQYDINIMWNELQNLQTRTGLSILFIYTYCGPQAKVPTKAGFILKTLAIHNTECWTTLLLNLHSTRPLSYKQLKQSVCRWP